MNAKVQNGNLSHTTTCNGTWTVSAEMEPFGVVVVVVVVVDDDDEEEEEKFDRAADSFPGSSDVRNRF